MPKYRLIESHSGDPSTVKSEFTACSDAEAIEITRKERKKKENLYSYLWLERVNGKQTIVNIPVADKQ